MNVANRLNLKNFLPIIILIILYYVVGELVFFLTPNEKIVTINIFFPEGIALAFAIIYGYRVVIGVFIGQLLLALFNNIDLIPALEVSFINSLEALLGVYLFDKFDISKSLDTYEDFIKLSGLIMFILQPFSAIISNMALIFYFQTPIEEFFYNSFSWWFGNVMGQILVTPFLLLVFSKYKNINFKELFLYSLIFIVYLYLIEIIVGVEDVFVLLALTLFISILITLYKGIVFSVLFNILLVLVSAYAIYIGVGAFVSNDYIENNINYNLFILLNIVMVWTIHFLQIKTGKNR